MSAWDNTEINGETSTALGLEQVTRIKEEEKNPRNMGIILPMYQVMRCFWQQISFPKGPPPGPFPVEGGHLPWVGISFGEHIYASEQSNDKALCVDWCTLLRNNIHTKIHFFLVLLLRRKEKRTSWYFIVLENEGSHWKTLRVEINWRWGVLFCPSSENQGKRHSRGIL